MNTNGIKGRTIARVVFLITVNPDTDKREALAYFPDMPWDNYGKNMTSYMHNGQHGPCCEAFALLDCKPVVNAFDRKAANELKAELESIGYDLEVLDSQKWVKDMVERKTAIRRNVEESTAITDSEALLNVYKTRLENEAKRAAKTA